MGDFISDVIGDSYKLWKKAEPVFITSQTGTGKTTFITEALLKHCRNERRKVLFFVNRKVLKLQLEEEIVQKEQGLNDYIEIHTYQELETDVKVGDVNRWEYIFNNNYYVVCDEAHYFLEDALYNSATEISFRFILSYLTSKVVVFISATINEMADYIQKLHNSHQLNYFCVSGASTKFKDKTYTMKPNYSYFDIKCFFSIDDIPGIVLNAGKSLVFYDNKKKNQEMAATVREKCKDTVLNIDDFDEIEKEYLAQAVDRDYDEEIIASTSVGSIKTNRSLMSKQKVIFCTSFLDNGVSISDLNINRIVVVSDSRTQFLQEIGRVRRKDTNRKIELWIYAGDKNDLNKKINGLKRSIDAYAKLSNNTSVIKDIKGIKGLKRFKNSYYITRLMYTNNDLIDYIRRLTYATQYKDWENDEDSGAYFFLSDCSIRKIYDYRDKLKIIMQKMQEDSDALLKEQLGWLGISKPDALRMINDSRADGLERIQKDVVKYFDSHRKFKTKEELLKFKKRGRDDKGESLHTILKDRIGPVLNIQEDGSYTKLLDQIRKNDRSLTEKVFEDYCKIIGIEGYSLKICNEKDKYAEIIKEDE